MRGILATKLLGNLKVTLLDFNNQNDLADSDLIKNQLQVQCKLASTWN